MFAQEGKKLPFFVYRQNVIESSLLVFLMSAQECKGSWKILQDSGELTPGASPKIQGAAARRGLVARPNV